MTVPGFRGRADRGEVASSEEGGHMNTEELKSIYAC